MTVCLSVRNRKYISLVYWMSETKLAIITMIAWFCYAPSVVGVSEHTFFHGFKRMVLFPQVSLTQLYITTPKMTCLYKRYWFNKNLKFLVFFEIKLLKLIAKREKFIFLRWCVYKTYHFDKILFALLTQNDQF